VATPTTAAERADLRAALRDFLSDQHDESVVRASIESGDGFDRHVWTQLAGQLGLAGLLVPEEHGGQGMSTVELGVALQESGRALLGGPYLGSAVLATTALLRANDEPAAKRLLPGLVDGSIVAALALDHDPAAPMRASQARDGEWTLTGASSHVVDLPAADTAVVVAEADEGMGLFVLGVTGSGVECEQTAGLDITRRTGVLRLTGAPAQRVGGRADAAVAATREVAAFAAAAEQAGIAARCLEIAVDYAKTREQFGRPIGSFQAMKHQLAEHLVRVEQMRAVVDAAAVALAADPASAHETVSVAKAYCGEAGAAVAEGLIDVLGGIGYTWEHVAHLYLRRMQTLAYLFGSPGEHRARLAAHLGLVQGPAR
jgi:alkylation response protein AidB-like acyl-CoA dehydrogenase